jgi:hypothetical protein
MYKYVVTDDQVLILSQVTRKSVTETHGIEERRRNPEGTVIRKTALFRATVLLFITSPQSLPWI